jgi:hypothetical protein
MPDGALVCSQPEGHRRPYVGYPSHVLGAIASFLETFCGHLSPKIDKVSEELTLRYPHEEPCVGELACLPPLFFVACLALKGPYDVLPPLFQPEGRARLPSVPREGTRGSAPATSRRVAGIPRSSSFLNHVVFPKTIFFVFFFLHFSLALCVYL